MARLTVSGWASKVKSAQADLPDTSVVRVGEDGELEDATLEQALQGVPGVYRLIDGDGNKLSECVVGRGGSRLRAPSEPAYIAARANASAQAAATDAFDRLTTHLTGMLKEKDQRIDELRKECADFQEQNLELRARVHELENGGSDQSELYALIRDCVPLLLGNKTKEELASIAMRIAPQLSPEARQEILPLLNQELAAQKSNMLSSFIQKGQESE